MERKIIGTTHTHTQSHMQRRRKRDRASQSNRRKIFTLNLEEEEKTGGKNERRAPLSKAEVRAELEEYHQALKHSGIADKESLLTPSLINKIVENKASDKQLHALLLKSVQTNDVYSLFDILQVFNKLGCLHDYNKIVDSKGCSLLSIAAAYGDVLALLVLFGNTNIDVNHRNNEGYTAISIAAYYRNLETINMLLSFGADLSIRNNIGESPLIVAANQLHCSKDEAEFQLVSSILVTLFEASPFVNKSSLIRDYTKGDMKEKVVIDKRTRAILNHWLKDRKKFRALWIPPYDMYFNTKKVESRLNKEFNKRRNEIRYWPWMKIAFLLGFCVYDVLLQGITVNLLLYIGLFALAYYV